MSDFDPDKFLHETASAGEFDPDAFLKQTAVKPTEVESALYGAGHGLTFGQAPTLVGAGKAAVGKIKGEGDFGDLYGKYSKEYKKKQEEASKTNPKSYLAGDVGGAVLSPINALVPGGGWIKGAASGAVAGGLMAAGDSDRAPLQSYDEAKGFAKDVGKGAALGVAGGTLGTAAGKAISGIPDTVKKGAAVLLGAPEEAVEKYIQNPEAVRAAPSLTESVQTVKDLVSKLKNETTSGSQAARKSLETDYTGEEVANFFQSKISDIMKRSEGAVSPQDASTIKFLQNQMQPFSGDNAVKTFSGNRVKDLVQNLQRMSKFNAGPADFSAPDQAALKSVSSGINQNLKEKSPQYAEEMKQVASDADLLKRVGGMFKSDQGLSNTLNRVRRDRAPFAEQNLSDLDQRFGTDTIDQLKNSLYKEAFEKGAGGPGGSRNVNLYKDLFGDALDAQKIPLGRALGGAVGGTVDRYGPGMAKKGIDVYHGVTTNPTVRSYLDALQRGGAAVENNLPYAPNVNQAIVDYLNEKYGKK